MYPKIVHFEKKEIILGLRKISKKNLEIVKVANILELHLPNIKRGHFGSEMGNQVLNLFPSARKDTLDFFFVSKIRICTKIPRNFAAFS